MNSVEVLDETAAAMLQTLLDSLDGFVETAYIELYAAERPAVGATICKFPLTRPAGVIVDAELQLEAAAGALTLTADPPRSASLFSGSGARMVDMKARLVTDADDPLNPAPVVVLAATTGAGVFLRLVSAVLRF